MSTITVYESKYIAYGVSLDKVGGYTKPSGGTGTYGDMGIAREYLALQLGQILRMPVAAGFVDWSGSNPKWYSVGVTGETFEERYLSMSDWTQFQREFPNHAERIVVFDFVLHNGDRHGRNVIIGKSPVLIDHGLAWDAYGQGDDLLQRMFLDLDSNWNPTIVDATIRLVRERRAALMAAAESTIEMFEDNDVARLYMQLERRLDLLSHDAVMDSLPG